MAHFQTVEIFFGLFHISQDVNTLTLSYLYLELSRQVVGGADHGGVLVRSGFELTSELAETRLSTGAVVKVGTHRINWRWSTLMKSFANARCHMSNLPFCS